MKQARLFTCVECGGDVVEAKGPGRSSEYRLGVALPVPADFAVPTCRDCAEQYFTVERGQALAEAQAPLYEEWLKEHTVELIALLRHRHGTTLGHLENACGVTRTYFSKLLGGKKKTSLQLVRLLEAFEAAPHELERHLDGRAWKSSDAAATILATPLMQPSASVERGRVQITAEAPAAYKGAAFDLGSASNDNRTAA